MPRPSQRYQARAGEGLTEYADLEDLKARHG